MTFHMAGAGCNIAYKPESYRGGKCGCHVTYEQARIVAIRPDFCSTIAIICSRCQILVLLVVRFHAFFCYNFN